MLGGGGALGVTAHGAGELALVPRRAVALGVAPAVELGADGVPCPAHTAPGDDVGHDSLLGRVGPSVGLDAAGPAGDGDAPASSCSEAESDLSALELGDGAEYLSDEGSGRVVGVVAGAQVVGLGRVA